MLHPKHALSFLLTQATSNLIVRTGCCPTPILCWPQQMSRWSKKDIFLFESAERSVLDLWKEKREETARVWSCSWRLVEMGSVGGRSAFFAFLPSKSTSRVKLEFLNLGGEWNRTCRQIWENLSFLAFLQCLIQPVFLQCLWTVFWQLQAAPASCLQLSEVFHAFEIRAEFGWSKYTTSWHDNFIQGMTVFFSKISHALQWLQNLLWETIPVPLRRKIQKSNSREIFRALNLRQHGCGFLFLSHHVSKGTRERKPDNVKAEILESHA